MPVEIRVPRLGWSMEEGGFVGWLKQSGDLVKAGDPLFTLEGDKAAQEIEATDAGILFVPPGAPKPGSPVVVGALLGYLLGPNEKPPPQATSPLPTRDSLRPPPSTKESPAPTSTPSLPAPASAAASQTRLRPSSGRQSISPRALRAAAELQVDWTTLQGTGRSGRIREKDVLAAARVRPAGGPSAGPEKAGATTSRGGSRFTPPIKVPTGTVVVTDWTFADLAVEEGILKPLGVDFIARQCRSESDLIALVTDADVVITQFGRLTCTVIGAMRRARAIVRYGIGVDNIDLDAARDLGIPVANVPDYCIDEVADQTLAFILTLTRQVVSYHQQVSQGQWGLGPQSMHALAGLTVGVVGFGRIGRAVVQRLAAFRPRIVVFDPMVAANEIERHGAGAAATLEELLSRSDVLTLHCPSTPQTRRMLDARALAKLKKGALLVNVARGDIIDTDALVQALRDGQIAGAALDVCDPEPIPSEHPLLKMRNVVLAPHVASVSEVAVRTLRETVATLAALALANGLPPNIVNGVARPRSVVA